MPPLPSARATTASCALERLLNLPPNSVGLLTASFAARLPRRQSTKKKTAHLQLPSLLHLASRASAKMTPETTKNEPPAPEQPADWSAEHISIGTLGKCLSLAWRGVCRRYASAGGSPDPRFLRSHTSREDDRVVVIIVWSDAQLSGLVANLNANFGTVGRCTKCAPGAPASV